MSGAGPALEFARRTSRHATAELMELVSIPSVSADPGHIGDVRRCAAWLATRLRTLGASGVRLVPGRRHPIVLGKWRDAPPGSPTVLLYAHYDVAPPGPPAAWRWPPFTPLVRGGVLHGRGASDDKGPLLAHLKAIESFLRTSGTLPVKVACVFEGEEEIGGDGLIRLLQEGKHLPRIDLAVISDTRMRDREHPAITYALRGVLGLELEVSRRGLDLHAGAFGGAVHDALEALCDIVASLHDADGHVAVRGFYDRVREVSAEERAYLRTVAPADADILRDAGTRLGWGEPGFSLYERTTIRPTISVASIRGSLGDSATAAIPARARSRLDVRLVPDQVPGEVEHLIRRHIARVTSPSLGTRLTHGRSIPPVVLDTSHPAVHAAIYAYTRGFNASPVLLRSGGTIPVAGALAALGVPTVLLGFALPDDGMHAPNEKFELGVFRGAIATCIHLLAALADLGSPAAHHRSANAVHRVRANGTAAAAGATQ